MRLFAISVPLLSLAALGTATLLQAAPAQSGAARGKVLFLRCAACHAVSSTAPGKVGPHLQGVVGRKAGSVAKFNYSPAMKAAKVSWDDKTLDRWLQRPASVVPGTSMVFAGMPNAEDRTALIAYLKKPTP